MNAAPPKANSVPLHPPFGRTIERMKRELILALEDLAQLGIQCPACKSVTIIALSNRNARSPKICACGEEFYKEHQRNETPLDNLLHALRTQPSAYVVTFRVAIPPLQP